MLRISIPSTGVQQVQQGYGIYFSRHIHIRGDSNKANAIASKIARSFRSDTNANVQRNQLRNNNGRQATATPARKSDFSQQFRVQPTNANTGNNKGNATPPNPRINGTQNKISSSKLKEFLCQESASKARQADVRQFGRSGSSNGKARQSGLVGFFQDRLAEMKATSEVESDKPSSAALNRPVLAQTLRKNQQRSPTRGGVQSNKKSAILYAAGNQHKAANQVDRKSLSIIESLNKTQTGGSLSGIRLDSTREGAAKEPKPESPISIFIQALQKKKKEDELLEISSKASSPPERQSWRKNTERRLEENKPVDSLFVSSKYDHRQDQEKEDDPSHLYSKHFAGLQQERNQPQRPQIVQPRKAVLPSDEVSVKELSPILGVKERTIMKTLEDLGETPKNDDVYKIDVDVVEMIAMELRIPFERQKRRNKVELNDHKKLMERRKATEEGIGELEKMSQEPKEELAYDKLARRPPVVCIMGHVDHGKTTLMDSLRRMARRDGTKQKQKSKKSKKGDKKQPAGKGLDVAGTEAGGITQVISAFQVPLGDQQDSLTFLDTPGHAAFSSMRQSGSHAADVIVLVIAADDGVSPQTVEILNFYKSIVKDSDGGITMVVAMNKIDKPGIDVNECQTRIENELLEHGIVPEGVATESEYGSPVQVFPISAKTGEGVDDMVAGLALQSEIMDLRADETARAEGIVMDSRVEQGLGVVVDCIVRWGSIKQGDVVVSGTSTGKIRILKDVDNITIKKGTPSQPVRLVGFKTPPKAGDPIVCVASEQIAEDLVSRRQAIQDRERSKEDSGDPNSNFSQVIISGRESMTATGTERKLDKYDLDLEGGGTIRIPVVIKAKADGSVAAVRDSLVALGGESSFDLNIDIVAEGVGPLSRNDIEMAKASAATVFCFDVKNNDKTVLAMAEAEGVPIHEYDVIYSLLDEAKELFTEYLPPIPVETIHGKAKVQEVFSISGGKETIAGLSVLDGHLYKSSVEPGNKSTAVSYRVIRNGERVSPEGTIVTASSLKKFKDDAESVRQGEECGLSLNGTNDFEEGDVIECFSVKMVKSFNSKSSK